MADELDNLRQLQQTLVTAEEDAERLEVAIRELAAQMRELGDPGQRNQLQAALDKLNTSYQSLQNVRLDALIAQQKTLAAAVQQTAQAQAQPAATPEPEPDRAPSGPMVRGLARARVSEPEQVSEERSATGPMSRPRPAPEPERQPSGPMVRDLRPAEPETPRPPAEPGRPAGPMVRDLTPVGPAPEPVPRPELPPPQRPPDVAQTPAPADDLAARRAARQQRLQLTGQPAIPEAIPHAEPVPHEAIPHAEPVNPQPPAPVQAPPTIPPPPAVAPPTVPPPAATPLPGIDLQRNVPAAAIPWQPPRVAETPHAVSEEDHQAVEAHKRQEQQRRQSALHENLATVSARRKADAAKPGAVASAATGAGEAAAAGAQALGSVATAGLAAGKALLALPDTIGSLAGPFTQVVQQFSPATVMQFQQALQDLSASLGNIVEPVVDGFKAVADMLNSVFTEIGPVLKPVVAEIAGVLKDLAGTLLADLQPAIAVAADGFKSVVSTLRPILEALNPVLAQLGPIVADLVAQSMIPLRITMAVLVPVVQALAPLFATIGAVLNEASAAMKELGDALWEFAGPILQPVLQGVQSVFQGIMNAVRDAIAGFGAVIATLQYMARTITEAGAWSAQRLRSQFSEAFERLRHPGGEANRTPTGGRTLAAGTPSYIDTAEIGRQARLQALQVRSETTLNTEAMRELREQIQRQNELLERQRNVQLPQELRDRGVQPINAPDNWFGFGGLN